MSSGNDIFRVQRNSKMFLNEVYFWTDTIRDWKHLLNTDEFKQLIIESWKYLVQREKVSIYGFVIMPNHIHVVWEMKEKNGKEMPHASFNKFTAHQFLLKLSEADKGRLKLFGTPEEIERSHRFWQRDPLAVLMDSKEKVEQKLNYIHLNPLQDHWNLAKRPEDYKWSSACFYERGIDEFGIITDYRDRF